MPWRRRAIERGDGDRFLHLGHVARLAGVALWIVAVLPLQERHLLGKRADLLTLGPERFGEEGVATAAQGGVADVVAVLRHQAVGGRLHDALMPVIDDEGAILRTMVDVTEAGERDVAVE